jgi:hypothetical protein
VQEIVDFWAESEAEKSHREAANASDSDAKSLAIIKRLGHERGGNFFMQTLLCHNRSLIQQFRLIPALVLEIGVALLAGNLFASLPAFFRIINGERYQLKPILGAHQKASEPLFYKNKN